MTAAITRTNGTSIQREGFGERGLEQRHETASTAAAAQARAQIEARYIVAMQRPRNEDDVRVRLLKKCERPTFAARAFYSLPKGNKPGRLTGTKGRIEGLSVRFAEEAIRASGNIGQDTTVLYDDDYKRMIRVAATDLESNTSYSRDLIIDKTVERSSLQDGQVALATRTNAAGADVYIVQATESDFLVKESNLVSRTFRTEAMRFVDPGTIEECEQQIIATIRDKDAKDPDAGRKEVADAFASLNVMPSDLSSYLGHDLGQCSPAQILELRGIFGAIKDGAITWAQLVTEKTSTAASDEPKAQTAGGSVAERVAANTERRRREKAAAQPTPAAVADPTPQQPSQAPPPPARAPSQPPGVQTAPAPQQAPPAAPSSTAAEHRRVAAERKAGKAPVGQFPGDPSPVPCAVCGQPVVHGIAMTTPAGGQGLRHAACTPPAVADGPPEHDGQEPPDEFWSDSDRAGGA